MNEDDLRAFDDEDAFASAMDCDNYENEFSSLLLEGEETEIGRRKKQQQQHEPAAAIGDVLLPDTPELGGRANDHLPRFRVGDYVKISPSYFYPSPEDWPYGSIVSIEPRRRGNVAAIDRNMGAADQIVDSTITDNNSNNNKRRRW